LYFIIGIASNSPMFASALPASAESMRTAALLDPFAISTFFEHTQFWTPFEKNSNFLSFSGSYVWNRILWLSCSFVLLGITYRFFSFRPTLQQRKKRPKADVGQYVKQIYQANSIRINHQSQWAAFWASVKIDIKGTVKSLPFLAILLILLVALVFNLYARFAENGFHDEVLYPYTHIVIKAVIEIIPILSKIIIIFYSAELVWKAKEKEFDLIINATPALNWVFFFTKLVALFLLPLLLIGTLILVCLAFQILSGFTNINFGAYLFLFYQHGIPALILSILAIFIQSLFKQKYLGMGITGLLILILTTSLGFNLGIEHPMLRMGYMPNITYSQMAGYDIRLHTLSSYAWYWLSLGAVLSILSFKLWNRQVERSRRIGVYLGWKKWKQSELILLSLTLTSLILSASNLYAKIHQEGRYQSSLEHASFQEEYERKFKPYQDIPKLHFSTKKTLVDFYPSTQQYAIKAKYTLINQQKTPITQVFITERKKLKKLHIENAQVVLKDSIFGTYLFEFKNPILPGQTLSMDFHLAQQSLPFLPDYTIAQNGTYLRHEIFEPILGYDASREIADPQERKKRNLPSRVSTSKSKGQRAGNENIYYNTIVSTSDDQTALAPGNLSGQWTKDGRNYFQYEYPSPNVPIIAYLSAQYEQKRQTCQGIDIDYYYHPGHNRNHPTIEASTCATLDYCLENFGSYPLDHLRIAEMPSRFPYNGTAQPGLIGTVENKINLVDLSKQGNINLVTARIAKLVAHQWWGMALMPKQAPGSGLLTPGLTEYTAALILEEMYGLGALWEQSKKFNETYFRGRTFARTLEPPLYQEMRENYLIRGKSGLVLLALRDLIGEKQINTTLRQLIDQHASSPEYSVGIQDFIEELYKVGPVEYHQLIDEWMKQIIRYDLKVEQVDYEQLADGRFEISATIAAQRFRTLASGQEITIDINEPIKLGLFDRHPKNLGTKDRPVYLNTHQIKDGNTTIKIIVDTLPKYISIDPFLTRTDRNYADNLKAVAK
ncbi:MAG: hypothetical protein AAF242_08730, partial [Bacteroidota bacterium]